MKHLDFCEFYITNVCNLTCDNCNRFNNFNVKDRMEFDKELYAPWAEKVDFGYIGLIGGEPLLHPNLKQWVEGIRELWPDTTILITSNGTHLLKHPGLFDFCSQKNAVLEISFHDEKIDQDILAQIDVFKRKGTNWVENKDIFETVDRDGKPLEIPTHRVSCDEGFVFEFNQAHHFQQNQIRTWRDGKPVPYDTDPKQAHYVCGMNKSHTFYDGKLYKCGFIPSVKNFLTQYGYATPEWKKAFDYIPHVDLEDIDRLQGPEDVCSLCPPKYIFEKVNTSFK